MKLLLTNDDGINKEGIHALIQGLSNEHEIYVVAPDSQRSGYSHAVTYFYKDIRCKKVEIDGCMEAYATSGTPADCVYVALNGLLDVEIDLVISGVNHGMNLASDVMYSGTVGAAVEGTVLGKPSIAISLCSYTSTDFDACVEVLKLLIPTYMEDVKKELYPLNVNVPSIPYSEIKGFKVCKLAGIRSYARTMHKEYDGHEIVMHSENEAMVDAIEEDVAGDFYAIKHGYVSLTPLQLDQTHFEWNQKRGRILHD